MAKLRWGGRVVEGDGLENRYTLTGIVGSNPTPTALEKKINWYRGFESHRDHNNTYGKPQVTRGLYPAKLLGA